jgi:hypothetical protein
VPGPAARPQGAPDPRHLAGVRCLAIAAAAEAQFRFASSGERRFVRRNPPRRLLLASGLLRAAGAWYLSR